MITRCLATAPASPAVIGFARSRPPATQMATPTGALGAARSGWARLHAAWCLPDQAGWKSRQSAPHPIGGSTAGSGWRAHGFKMHPRCGNVTLDLAEGAPGRSASAALIRGAAVAGYGPRRQIKAAPTVVRWLQVSMLPCLRATPSMLTRRTAPPVLPRVREAFQVGGSLSRGLPAPDQLLPRHGVDLARLDPALHGRHGRRAEITSRS